MARRLLTNRRSSAIVRAISLDNLKLAEQPETWERAAVLKIALLQMTAFGLDQEKNLSKGEEYCRVARSMGADIALFPEMWNLGYTPYNPHVWRADYDPLNLPPEELELRARWQALGVGADDAFVVHFRELARELDMAIALTYLEKWPGAPRDSVSLINRRGEIVLTYAQVHSCDFSLGSALTPGDGFRVATLDATQGRVKVGAMICFDREFPESARILMLQGAEIILTPNACELGVNRLGQFRARAFENMVGVAMANYAGRKGAARRLGGSNGHSVAFDGMAFNEDGRSRDMLVLEAPEDEGIYLAEFPLDQLRAYRKREVWGNAYRKPGHYGVLTSPDIEEPFIRSHARR